MQLAGLGVAIGLVLAAFSSRLLTALLFNVSPMDLLTFGSMSVVFITVALVACYLPARRAATADPIQVLRAE